jgi:hypothetical protein
LVSSDVNGTEYIGIADHGDERPPERRIERARCDAMPSATTWWRTHRSDDVM